MTPVKQFLSVDAGTTIRSSFSVRNDTSSSRTVMFSVEQFSVADYTYRYTFQPPANDWIHTGATITTLAPNEEMNVPYAISVPAHTAPGGYYFTLLASTTATAQGLMSTTQVADLVYLTVTGKLTTVSHLQGSSISHLVFGRTISYSLEPVNTGNVYTFVYLSGHLSGLLVPKPETSTAHILLPGKVRTLSSSISSPILPGIYHATYGYKTSTNWVVQQSAWVVFIPPWSIAVLLAALLLGIRFYYHRKPPTEES